MEQNVGKPTLEMSGGITLARGVSADRRSPIADCNLREVESWL